MQRSFRTGFSKPLVLTELFPVKLLLTALETIQVGTSAFAIPVQQIPVSIHLDQTRSPLAALTSSCSLKPRLGLRQFCVGDSLV